MWIASSGHDVEDLQEEVIRLLSEHEAEKRAAFSGRVVAQVFPKQFDLATNGLDACRKRLEQRRLSRAVGTRQSHDIAFAEADVDLGNQRLAFVTDQQMICLEDIAHNGLFNYELHELYEFDKEFGTQASE